MSCQNEQKESDENVSIEEFISNSLIGIMRGIEKAQKNLGSSGSKINPRIFYLDEPAKAGKLLVTDGQDLAEFVEFNLSVSVNRIEGKKANISMSIFRVNANGGVENTGRTDSSSRIIFKVPVVFPRL
ncbi:hypothetical protein [Candidatus Magnetaquiglobus chichijimensis]|uniref:hypothetical protein n=1 Tax=Candidatus Magnetaquiglobus chichijimensis TaxID=3141448 RepID=UPI003B96BE1B